MKVTKKHWQQCLEKSPYVLGWQGRYLASNGEYLSGEIRQGAQMSQIHDALKKGSSVL